MGRPSPRTALAGVALTALLMACGNGAGPASGGVAVPMYGVVRDLPLAGGSSRWEYPVLDIPAHRLYLAHAGANEVVVVDTERQRVTATVPSLEEVEGLALASERGLLYATVKAAGQVAAIDVASGRVVSRVPAGTGPDSLVYVAAAGRVFVSDEDGPGDVVIDGRTGAQLAPVELGGDIGDSRYDPWSGLVLVAVGSRNELAAIDPRSLGVVRRYGLPDCSKPHGVQVDTALEDRVFIACQGNARLVTLDLGTGQVAGAVNVAASPDVLALDPELHRLYVASETGVLTVVDVASAVPRPLTHGYAGPDAHSVAVDPDTHVVYLPLPGVGGPPVLRELRPR